MADLLGVGFVGAGAATQAIHLPALAALNETFTVRHVMDVDADTADAVAGRVGACASSSIESLLEDPAVDVVAVCSPPRFHPAHIEAACRAGVKAVLCEKPLALSTEEAQKVAEIVRETGVPVVVGAMHAFDPAWVWARKMVAGMGRVHSVRSRIVLPPNARFEDMATEIAKRTPGRSRNLAEPAARAAFIEAAVFGVTVHDLPLIRELAPKPLRVLGATLIEPAGFAILAESDDTAIELIVSMNENWKPDWTLEAISDTGRLLVEFAPSFVQSGSGKASYESKDGVMQSPPSVHNGYAMEWLHVADLARRTDARPGAMESLVADLDYTMAVAEAAGRRVLEESK